MGQRSQIYISIPKIYYNENNPNNRPRRHVILHNQWLYGFSFVNWSNAFLEALEHIIYEDKNATKKGKQYAPDIGENELNRAIQYANYKDVKSMRKATHWYNSTFEDSSQYLQKWQEAANSDLKDSVGTIGEWLDLNTDNNNGFLLVYIHDNGEIIYQILTGYEDTPNQHRDISPREYIKLFYTDVDLLGAAMSEKGQFDGLIELSQRKRLNVANLLLYDVVNEPREPNTEKKESE